MSKNFIISSRIYNVLFVFKPIILNSAKSDLFATAGRFFAKL